MFEERHHVVSLTGDYFVRPSDIIKKIMPNERDEIIRVAESKILSMTQLRIKAKNNYGLTNEEKIEKKECIDLADLVDSVESSDSEDERPKKIKKNFR